MFAPSWSRDGFRPKKNSGSGIRFFRIFGKTGSRIRNFFGLKPSPDQDGANKKQFSQIGPAVPELLRDTHTHIQTDRQTKTLITL